MVQANARALAAASPSPADLPTSRLAIRSSRPDVEVTDATRDGAVAAVDGQALVGEKHSAGADPIAQGQADSAVQVNGMTSHPTTARRAP